MGRSKQLSTKQFLYLGDLHIGQRFISDTRLIDEDEIKAFAKQFDPQPFHLDPTRAASAAGAAQGVRVLSCGNVGQ